MANQGEAEEQAKGAQEGADAREEAATAPNGQEDREDGDGANEVDRHGHKAISEGKYARDIKERDDKIAELEAKIAEAAKTEQTAAELMQQIAAVKAEYADKEVDWALKLQDCLDVKAAKARLEDFDGSVEKLKEACPYLFKKKEQKGSTGFRPEGAADGADERLAKARRIAGVRTKK